MIHSIRRHSSLSKSFTCSRKAIMPADLAELRTLPASEKLRIVEQLWDDIGASEEPVIIQDWHKSEASRRLAELQANPALALSRDELWRQVDRVDG